MGTSNSGAFARGTSGFIWSAIAGLSFLSLAGGVTLVSQFLHTQTGIPICRVSNASVLAAAVADPRGLADWTFMSENEAAMNRMMAAMAIAPTGDVDHDFVEIMSAHHEGAINMAIAELRYGHNEQLRRIAQEIIVTQKQEIRAMSNAMRPAYSVLARQSASATSFGATATSAHNELANGTTEGIRQ